MNPYSPYMKKEKRLISCTFYNKKNIFWGHLMVLRIVRKSSTLGNQLGRIVDFFQVAKWACLVPGHLSFSLVSWSGPW